MKCSGWPTTACNSASSPPHRAQIGAQRPEASADELDEHLEVLHARHALGEQVALDPLDGCAEAPRLAEHLVEPAAEPALVLAQRARDRGLDARRQDRCELARGTPQLVDVPFRPHQQRAQVRTGGLARAQTALAHLADAAEGRLARVPQRIVLDVLGVHVPPLRRQA